jgi:hypothetical protein
MASMKKFACLIATAAVISSGCQKKEVPAKEVAAAPLPQETVAQSEPELPIANHLGIATRIPADVDLFVAGYDVGETILKLFEPMFYMHDGQGNREALSEVYAKTKEAQEVMGDEAFVFIGSGFGVQF